MVNFSSVTDSAPRRSDRLILFKDCAKDKDVRDAGCTEMHNSQSRHDNNPFGAVGTVDSDGGELFRDPLRTCAFYIFTSKNKIPRHRNHGIPLGLTVGA